MLTALKEILESSGGPAPEEEILSFSDYLELVKTEPWITRNTFGCRSGIYNGVNILQTHCRWYVTHWFFFE